MLDAKEVLYTAPNGTQITAGDVQNREDLLRFILSHGCYRAANSSRSGGHDKAEKDAKENAFWESFKEGHLPSRGGGNRLSEFDREWRDILIAQLVALGRKQTEAKDSVRKDAEAALRIVAAAKLKANGKNADRQNVDAAVEKVREAIDAKAAELVQRKQLDVDI